MRVVINPRFFKGAAEITPMLKSIVAAHKWREELAAEEVRTEHCPLNDFFSRANIIGGSWGVLSLLRILLRPSSTGITLLI